MLIMPNLTSDEVSIESLHRDASPVQKDYNNTPYFDVLSFELTAIPSERWIERFNEHVRSTRDTRLVLPCNFEGATLAISTSKTYVNSLQEFIDLLKKTFEDVNEYFKLKRDREVEEEKHINDILDNLKF
ncbi:TPA: hypothetical protein ACG0DS_000072 [Enterobacter sichuanensis]